MVFTYLMTPVWPSDLIQSSVPMHWNESQVALGNGDCPIIKIMVSAEYSSTKTSQLVNILNSIKKKL